MSTYCKLVGDKKMAKGKYITINEALDDDDWALIFDKQGDLKGLYIPRGSEESVVPKSIYEVCKRYFGVDFNDDDVFKDDLTNTTLH
jgi:hypothetical protein|tara:strand:+ start:13815 stop:14075 length:261 start_codon:yes stop_codon:yes gene_type:complete